MVDATPEQEAAYAKRVLARADKVLAAVDDAYIHRDHKTRQMPKFEAEEISLGPVLGTGGFGVVSEIARFFLNPDAADDDDDDHEAPNQSAGQSEQARKDSKESQNSDRAPPRRAISFDKENQEATPAHSDHHDAHVHYEVSNARKMMERRCLRNGSARYAIKRLHGNLSELERARGMIDLAVEAKILSVVWHPNIIKLRGIASGDLVSPTFFIVMDRLQETLGKRIKRWAASHKKNKGKILGIGRKKDSIKALLIERMTVAYDLAAAFFYMHEHRLVYRDIKTENIGFDIRGDVKVFDFGLCKSLNQNLKSLSSYGYKLTGRAGSLPYMAPEVVRMETYDTKCDVFSFAILLWEILSLKPAFEKLSPTDFVEKVVLKDQRLPISTSWPPLTRLMIPGAWDADPSKRPDMKRVAILIRGDLNDMTTDDSVRRRTFHMQDRSHHSIELDDKDKDTDL